MSKRWNHFKTIVIHKYYVGKYCFMCKLYWQGIVHDLSKFSPTEFEESVKYYNGRISPIIKAKYDKGYSEAWQHHKGRNKHHYEYWTDNYDNGTTTIKIPFKYVLEMICDFFGAGIAYNKDKKDEKALIKSEIAWWNSRKNKAFMHKDTKLLITIILNKMDECDSIKKVLGDKKLLKSLENTYNALD